MALNTGCDEQADSHSPVSFSPRSSSAMACDDSVTTNKYIAAIGTSMMMMVLLKFSAKKMDPCKSRISYYSASSMY